MGSIENWFWTRFKPDDLVRNWFWTRLEMLTWQRSARADVASLCGTRGSREECSAGRV
jgi:hypothetical protein